ncbi:MAG: PKD domain-containing protein [Methanophagales archaeon]|nr:PKD domain-containing protein [Methanophagales archaeon]
MKRKTIVGLIAVVAIATAIVFSGCIDEETPVDTPTPTVTPIPTLTPTPVSPTAKASATSTRAIAGENVSFSGADSIDSDGIITSYEWAFGDGTTASGAAVTHAYSNERTYTVKLTVTDNSSLSDTDTIEITVTAPRYTLSEAIDKGVVKAEITGSGASSGDSINLELTRLTLYTTEIRVPKGTVLRSSGATQNMVVYKVSGIPKGTMWITPASKIVLDSSEPQTFILEAYCLDFHKENPRSSTKFSVGTLTDQQILRILNASDNLTSDITSVGAIQTAIWVVTEDVSKKELVDRFPVEQKDIDNAKVILEEAGIDTTSKRLFR